MKHELDDTHWTGFLRSIPRRQLLLTLFYGILRVIAATIWPYLLFSYFKNNHHSNEGGTIVMIAAILIIFAVAGYAARRQLLINVAIMEAFSLRLVERMWKKMARVDWLIFHGKNRAYFFDIIMMDAWRLRQGMVSLLDTIIVNVVIAATLTFFTLFISVKLFVLCFVGQLAVGVLHLVGAGVTRPFLKRFHEAWREQHYWIAKAIDQVDLVKMGRAYTESEATNRKNTQTFLACNSALIKQQSKWVTINQAAGNAMRIVVFLTGLYWVQAQFITLTDLLIVLLIVSVIQNNLSQLPRGINNLMEAREARNSLIAFFSLPDENEPIKELTPGMMPLETISMQDVTFSYGEKTVVNNADIVLQKGKIYLWNGANGSGKSTTAHILLGLITPQSGVLRINGEDVAWENLKQLRKRFAFLNQDALLFRGTIRENVIFGHPAGENAWDTVSQSWLAALLPVNNGGGKRQVGDQGEGLSGGEARRLILIREWLRTSDLFILDEPLNHLDEYAINEIKEAIVNTKEDRIAIIISHQKGFEKIADETREF